MSGRIPVVVLGLLLLVVATAVNAQVQVQALAPTKPIAQINGDTVSIEEIDKAIAAQLGKLQEQIYNLRRQRLDAVIRDRLFAQEAAKRGISVQKLLDAEVTAKVGLVSEEEIDRVFQANRARYKVDVDEAEVREQIRGQLQGQKIAAQREAFLQSLRKTAKVVIALDPPPIARVDVPIDGAPIRGAASAPITIVEFSDFHCPFCRRVEPTLKEIETRYGDKVKLVFRDYPLDQLHPGARKAHEAARCARDQGKFWEFHDAVFAAEPDSSPQRLRTYAEQVGIDVDKFEKCVASERYKQLVQKDVEEGARLGVNGTPTFFINGELLSGAQPLESFARLIDRELSRGR